MAIVRPCFFLFVSWSEAEILSLWSLGQWRCPNTRGCTKKTADQNRRPDFCTSLPISFQIKKIRVSSKLPEHCLEHQGFNWDLILLFSRPAWTISSTNVQFRRFLGSSEFWCATVRVNPRGGAQISAWEYISASRHCAKQPARICWCLPTYVVRQRRGRKPCTR